MTKKPLPTIQDFGFTFEDDVPPAPAITDTQAEALQKLEQRVMSLVRGLQREPDKVNIKWPNRHAQMVALEAELSELFATIRN